MVKYCIKELFLQRKKVQFFQIRQSVLMYLNNSQNKQCFYLRN